MHKLQIDGAGTKTEIITIGGLNFYVKNSTNPDKKTRDTQNVLLNFPIFLFHISENQVQKPTPLWLEENNIATMAELVQLLLPHLVELYKIEDSSILWQQFEKECGGKYAEKAPYSWGTFWGTNHYACVIGKYGVIAKEKHEGLKVRCQLKLCAVNREKLSSQ